jgi:hypothetical protein
MLVSFSINALDSLNCLNKQKYFKVDFGSISDTMAGIDAALLTLPVMDRLMPLSGDVSGDLLSGDLA